MNLFKHSRAAIMAATLTLGTAGTFGPALHPAFAQGVTRTDLNGSWVSDAGNSYVFRSNGTYTFTTGNTSTTNVSHSGTWQLRSGGTVLRLHSTSRVVVEEDERRTIKADKTFSLPLYFTDTEAAVLDIDGEEFEQ